ncbi:MAG: hypothetical protein KatS3mg124_0739 [Porticoccaceae bacterium]|nr:MAG: hypothetical protein KatS3mg124_0739 [Porticoccaceae bacterium]
MAAPDSALLLVLRRLRGTLIALVAIFAVAVLGLTLVPGPPGEDGRPTHLDFFHAFYFVSYTATTIGFGEIPADFSPAQRLWVTVCIYLSVVGWTIFITSALQLARDGNLRHTLEALRFRRAVKHLAEPFFLVCGHGETGAHLTRALDRLGYRVVILERDPATLAELDLADYRSDPLALAADAANPAQLVEAGLTHPRCRGVIALADDDRANLGVAIAARVLAPSVPVLARARSDTAAANLASFGTPHVIQAVHQFGEQLRLALRAPAAYRLLALLTGLPGVHRPERRNPPAGPWVLCGYGHFGRHLAEALLAAGQPVSVVEQRSRLRELAPAAVDWVEGDATGAAALEAAGVRRAAGIVAATGSDVDNLSIAVTARQLNPEIFVVLRQNDAASRPLFAGFAPDLALVPSEIIARQCLAILTTPLFAPFLDELYRAQAPWCEALLAELEALAGEEPIEVWSLRLNLPDAPALYRRLMRGSAIALGEVLRDPARRDRPLPAKPLALVRDGGERLLLPAPETSLAPGDGLLLAGTAAARRDLALLATHDHALEYALTGRDPPAGWLWQWLARRLA